MKYNYGNLKHADFFNYIGKVKNVVGMIIEASGLPASIGEICTLTSLSGKNEIMAEVVGCRNENILLMPYGDIEGIGADSLVKLSKEKLAVPVGDFLIGRTIDAMGNPIDELGAFENAAAYYNANASYTNPLQRPRIDTPISYGVKAIDGMLTIGKGQRMGIFSGSGVGKSTLLGMIAKNIKSDVNVIALVGERGREVAEFIEKDLGEEGLAQSVLVVATSDQPAMLRSKCPLVATSIAEYFRDQGKDVLLMMDSLTRYAMALREIGLATGEPPIARGYTPSIYAELPKLLERSGNFKKGSITAIYTVLSEGDDTNEPISDTVRGLIDGHIVLSRTLANRNHFPAIDINASISRIMNDIVSDEHKKYAYKIREILSTYYQNYDLISIGAYRPGTNPKLDEAVLKIDAVNRLLRQNIDEKFSYEETLEIMKEI